MWNLNNSLDSLFSEHEAFTRKFIELPFEEGLKLAGAFLDAKMPCKSPWHEILKLGTARLLPNHFGFAEPYVLGIVSGLLHYKIELLDLTKP